MYDSETSHSNAKPSNPVQVQLWSMSVDGRQLFRHCLVLHWVCRKTLVWVFCAFVRKVWIWAKSGNICKTHTGATQIANEERIWAEMQKRPRNKYSRAGKLSATHMLSAAKYLQIIAKYYREVFTARTRSRARLLQSTDMPRLEQHCTTKQIFQTSDIFTKQIFASNIYRNVFQTMINTHLPKDQQGFNFHPFQRLFWASGAFLSSPKHHYQTWPWWLIVT